jgi:ABC-2 type transport system ATP-binding protein
MNALVTDSLTKVFISRVGSTVAVKNFSVTIKPHTIYGLMGHNGAGKTTTFMLLNALLTPTDGSALIFGHDLVKHRSKIHNLTGLLTENLRLYDELTVEETLTFFADLYGVKAPVRELLRRFEMEEWRKQLVGKLSTGMRKKVSILSACIHRPKLLFLDEPFSGLDPVAMQSLREFIVYLTTDGDLTVVIASHNLKELAGLCEQVGIMKDGRLVVSGTMEQIKQRYGFVDRLQIRVERIPAGLGHLVTSQEKGLIELQNSADALNMVLHSLHEQGIAVLDVNKQAVALEEIYQRVYQEGGK